MLDPVAIVDGMHYAVRRYTAAPISVVLKTYERITLKRLFAKFALHFPKTKVAVSTRTCIVGVQKSFPPSEGYGAGCFAIVGTGEKSFASAGITPLIPLPPALPASRGEQGARGWGTHLLKRLRLAVAA
jgi:hypothetical protein